MPYYRVTLDRTCRRCTGTATCEVCTPSNEVVGVYCDACARAMLASLNGAA